MMENHLSECVHQLPQRPFSKKGEQKSELKKDEKEQTKRERKEKERREKDKQSEKPGTMNCHVN